jgi:hypothetical protein
VTNCVPMAEISEPGIDAVSSVSDTNVVATPLPFQLMVDEGRNLKPVTSRVKSLPPTTADPGLKDEITGAVLVGVAVGVCVVVGVADAVAVGVGVVVGNWTPVPLPLSLTEADGFPLLASVATEIVAVKVPAAGG